MGRNVLWSGGRKLWKAFETHIFTHNVLYNLHIDRKMGVVLMNERIFGNKRKMYQTKELSFPPQHLILLLMFQIYKTNKIIAESNYEFGDSPTELLSRGCDNPAPHCRYGPDLMNHFDSRTQKNQYLISVKVCCLKSWSMCWTSEVTRFNISFLCYNVFLISIISAAIIKGVVGVTRIIVPLSTFFRTTPLILQLSLVKRLYARIQCEC